MTVKRWRNKYKVAPIDVKPGDGFSLKIVGVAYIGWWTVYVGLGGWSHEKVARQGDPIRDVDLAGRLFPVLAGCGMPYDIL